ncbi:MAG: VWA domain-containing protein [Methanomicrobiales archaeon]|nr:VWA domain-containing protein [Methanomicrobiales archaeon]
MKCLTILVLLLVLIVGHVSAAPYVTMMSSTPFLTANGQESATITVKVTDASNAVVGADVLLDVSPLWSLKETAGKTDGSGKFVTTFLPTTRAGSAVIKARVTTAGVPSFTLVGIYTQEIVADDPQTVVYLYNSTATVGSLTGLSVLIKDRFGNPVSSKKTLHEVTFNIPLSTDGALQKINDKTTKFKGLSVPVNDSGYAEVGFILSTRPGTNYISIIPPKPLQSALITIQGVADAKPASLVQTVIPSGNPPTLRTDTSSRFVINYRLSDSYGNPSANQPLYIAVNTGEKLVITSNPEGNVSITYGPKKDAARYTITATALNNLSVTTQQVIQFLSFTPSNLLVTASPQTMASSDVKGDAEAFVMAKVIDDLGNPVPGQTVYFSIREVNNGSFATTRGPSIMAGNTLTSKIGEEVSAVTDGSGYAIATFTPSAFVTDGPNFNPMSQGVARVQARWGTKSQTLSLTYMNYPYLSISTSVDPMTVETNSTVQLSILVKGDGYALKPKPVDVYMVTDRSGSMSTGNPSRLALVKQAATAFTDKFDYSVDRLGQFSFGDDTYYSSDVTLDQSLTNDPGKIDAAISGLRSAGYTPLRLALSNAINELKKNGNSNSVKALVVLSDGDYNWYGDPLGRGSKGPDDYTDDSYYYECTRYYWKPSGVGIPRNLGEFAKSNNIRIYAIGYSDSLSDDGQTALRTLATSTGGKYYYALTSSDLLTFYTDIAGSLKDTAGVDTSLSLNFLNVDVTGIAVPGASALEYKYINGISTQVTGPKTSVTYNSTSDWNKGKINISMGTIKVNEEWRVDLTLKVKLSGNIKLLGSSSRVSFVDSAGQASSVPLPDTFVTAVPEGWIGGLEKRSFLIYNLRRVNENTDRDIASLAWNITYTGDNEYYDEGISVAAASSIFPSDQIVIQASKTDISGTYPLIISDLKPGTYKVMVTGRPTDVTSSSNVTYFTIPADVQTPEILIR